ncbi:hypothetical protein KO500_10680 [Cellulophaga baltica]|uniref:hypothetical protein n=1 Tax=Cellulophaga TaxID=104264 RepID=UPI001C07090E|nr:MULTISPECIES: hypothetical protein [Cellulophaga]MBU2996904.1 hypothetical protein [Cellulophaga baltica]MDO6768302.1 hypothetical protein [Cellulophaga sp. 1_MG-2023]
MKNQYCKVGAVQPINSEAQSIKRIENLLQNFTNKSSNLKYANTKLGEFFQSKAEKFEKLLNDL